MTTSERNEATNVTTVADRRRPGRLESVSPALIPMLRVNELPPLDDGIDDEPDQMSAARGVMVGVALAAPLWVGIVCLGRLLLT